jgi:hypothetical protein
MKLMATKKVTRRELIWKRKNKKEQKKLIKTLNKNF